MYTGGCSPVLSVLFFPLACVSVYEMQPLKALQTFLNLNSVSHGISATWRTWKYLTLSCMSLEMFAALQQPDFEASVPRRVGQSRVAQILDISSHKYVVRTRILRALRFSKKTDPKYYWVNEREMCVCVQIGMQKFRMRNWVREWSREGEWG